MLHQMRNAQSWMIKGVLWAVVLAFVVTIFYSWGVQSGNTPTQTEVATILGHRVGVTEFQRVQNSIYQSYRNILGNRTDINLQEQFNFREMALEQIARRLLLLHMAQQESLDVTAQELYDRIAAIPAFQEEGRFNADLYHSLLRQQVPPLTPKQFEEDQRQALLIDKVYDLVQMSVQVTEAEVEQAYRQQNEQVAVRYATLVPSLFTDQVDVTDQEVQDYYEAHKNAYREPEKRQFRYAEVSSERFPFTGELTREDMMGYYEAHKDTYTRPEEVRARHILIKVPPNASAELEAKIRTRVDEILAKLRDGEDFAALAKSYSEDPASAEQGGDLGFFPRGRMVPEFEKMVFSSPVGQISEPVRTQFGFHIIRVEDKTEAGVKTFEEAEPEIRDALRQERQAEATLTFVDDLMVRLEEDPTQFENLTAQHDLKVVTTPFLAQGDRLPDVDDAVPLVQRAFALTKGDVDSVTSADGKHYLMQLTAIQPSEVQPFETVEAEVREDLKQERSREIARKTADDWATQVQEGTSLETLAATLGVQVENTGLFKRDDAIPQFGRSPTFSRKAFDLQVNDAGAVQDGARYVVMQVTERQAASMEAFEAEKAATRERLMTQKQQRMRAAFNEALQAQYMQLRQEGEIVVNPQYVF